MKTRQTNKIDLEISKKLKQRRLELGLTQEQIGNSIGVTFQQIQKYERGSNRVSSSNLFCLSKILQTEVTYFFEQNDNSAYAFPPSTAFYASEGQVDYVSVDKEAEETQVHTLVSCFSVIKDIGLKQSIVELVKSLSRRT